jgi:hypothetical protein
MMPDHAAEEQAVELARACRARPSPRRSPCPPSASRVRRRSSHLVARRGGVGHRLAANPSQVCIVKIHRAGRPRCAAENRDASRAHRAMAPAGQRSRPARDGESCPTQFTSASVRQRPSPAGVAQTGDGALAQPVSMRPRTGMPRSRPQTILIRPPDAHPMRFVLGLNARMSLAADVATKTHEHSARASKRTPFLYPIRPAV